MKNETPSRSRRAVRRFVCGVIAKQIDAYLEAGQPWDDFTDAVARGDMDPAFAAAFHKRLVEEFKRESRKFYFWSGR